MTVAISPADTATIGASGVRVVPAPRSEPLTDDERASAGLGLPSIGAPLLPFDVNRPSPVRTRYSRGRGTTGTSAGSSSARSSSSTGDATAANVPVARTTGTPNPPVRAGTGTGTGTGTDCGGADCGGLSEYSSGDFCVRCDVADDRVSGVRQDSTKSRDAAMSRVDVVSTSDVGNLCVVGNHSVVSDTGTRSSPANGDPLQTVPSDVEPSPARLATRRFLATCVEVIGGFRPIAQLRPLCFADRFDHIADRLRVHPATGTAWRSRGLAHLGSRGPLSSARGGVVAPPRTGRVNQTAPGDRVVVRRVQVCEAIEGVAEIAVVLARRDQVWAMAVRMEHHRGRWLCAHLEVL